jgi:hypothetical protein
LAKAARQNRQQRKRKQQRKKANKPNWLEVRGLKFEVLQIDHDFSI